MYSFIDIKKDQQTVLMALAQFEIELEKCQLEGLKAIKVLHGYGSHGQGGIIKKELHKKLKSLEKQKKILTFIPCEKWDLTDKSKIIEIEPELIADQDLKFPNSGITIVILR